MIMHNKAMQWPDLKNDQECALYGGARSEK